MHGRMVNGAVLLEWLGEHWETGVAERCISGAACSMHVCAVHGTHACNSVPFVAQTRLAAGTLVSMHSTGVPPSRPGLAMTTLRLLAVQAIV
jgi:hypothetical protein